MNAVSIVMFAPMLSAAIRRVLTLLCLGVALCCVGDAAGANVVTGVRPNFVFIIGDDISAEDIGCYGNPGIRTPNLDRLASEGLRFDRAYVTASSCSPSRCSIITSRYPHNLEAAAELHGLLEDGMVLFPKRLRDADYYTAQAGKAHFGNNYAGLSGAGRAAFDVGGDGQPDELKAGNGGENQWIQRLRSRPMEQPFFMWFASHDAHRRWDADSFSGMNRPADVRVPPYLVDTPETRVDLAHYYDEITRLDYFVGEVVRELARQGVLNETVIVFTADNGRPFPHSKTQLYQDSIRTPLIVRWGQLRTTPATTKALASLIDIAPTILEIAGLPKPEGFQGVSLLPVLRDPAAGVRNFVFAEKNWHDYPAHARMAFDGRYVYIHNAWSDLPLWGAADTIFNPSADALKTRYAAGRLNPLQANIFLHPRVADELYDLETDPLQANNLVGNPGATRAFDRMKDLLARWTHETGDSVPAESERTPAGFDYVTGKKKAEFWRGKPPGAATGALHINRPGPIR